MKGRQVDVWIYAVLTTLLIIYAVYLRATCEEIGCLAVIIPIIGIFIISGIEFVINLIMMKKQRDLARLLTLLLTGVITLFAFVSILLSKVR